jgi:hypothetical protein
MSFSGYPLVVLVAEVIGSFKVVPNNFLFHCTSTLHQNSSCGTLLNRKEIKMLIYLFIALLLVILFVDTVDPGPSKTISLFWAFSEIKKNKIRIISEKYFFSNKISSGIFYILQLFFLPSLFLTFGYDEGDKKTNVKCLKFFFQIE